MTAWTSPVTAAAAAGVMWAVPAAWAARRVLRPALAAPPALDGRTGAKLLAAALVAFVLVLLVRWIAEPFGAAWEQAAVLAAAFAAAAFMISFSYAAAGPARLGPGRDIPRDLGRGVLCYLAVVPCVVALELLNRRLLPADAPTQEALRRIADAAGTPAFWPQALGVVVGAPLLEETLCRGLIQPGVEAQLAASASPRSARIGAVVLTSVFFTALHDPPAYLPAFVMSAVLGALFASTGRLSVAVGFHAAHNAAAVWFESCLRRTVEGWGLG